MSTTQVVVTILVAVFGGLGWLAPVLTWWSNRGKPRVEQQSMSIGNAEKALAIMERTMSRQEETICELQAAVKALEGKAAAQEAALREERREREKLQKQVAFFEALTDGDRAWIKRTITRIHAHAPSAWHHLLPLPDHQTDPGMPAIPRPPDDGQPTDLSQPSPDEGPP